MDDHFTDDQWIQQYPSRPMAPAAGEQYDDAAISSTPVYRAQDGPKPIRRRSRASRRTPVTILNATPTDFRALVQRFTGCDSKQNMASASTLPKGPVNIDFATNDTTESSSRNIAHFNSQPGPLYLGPPMQADLVQPFGGWNHFQAGYGIDHNASVVYESVDESSLTAAQRDIGRSHGYNI